MNNQTTCYETELKVAEQIRYEYTEHGETDFDRLQKLDLKVKRPGTIFAYSFGIVGALVLGIGMCLAMKVIGDLMALGIVVGIVGIAMVSLNYYFYRVIVKKSKRKYAGEIVKLSDSLLKQTV